MFLKLKPDLLHTLVNPEQHSRKFGQGDGESYHPETSQDYYGPQWDTMANDRQTSPARVRKAFQNATKEASTLGTQCFTGHTYNLTPLLPNSANSEFEGKVIPIL